VSFEGGIRDPTLADALDLAAKFADPARGADMLLYVDKAVLVLATEVRRQARLLELADTMGEAVRQDFDPLDAYIAYRDARRDR
jgi:hypothetical protein